MGEEVKALLLVWHTVLLSIRKVRNDQIFSSKTISIEVVVESIKFLLRQCLKPKKTGALLILWGSIWVTLWLMTLVNHNVTNVFLLFLSQYFFVSLNTCDIVVDQSMSPTAMSPKYYPILWMDLIFLGLYS